MIPSSELVLNPNGSIYHLNLLPSQIADKIIVVGDPGRVATISSFFDEIECKVHNREFVTHTGTFNGVRISAVATGIGTDNIDIVLNELDALVNIDLEKRTVKAEKRSLEIIRIGTCGSIQEDIKADQVIVSTHGFGLDGLLNFYDFNANQQEEALLEAILEATNWSDNMNRPYLVSGSADLVERMGEGYIKGMTITAPGFYAPQGRKLRLDPKRPNLNEALRAFHHQGHRLVNFEMETSALYGLSRLLGHQACTLCAVVANRYANSFSKDYKPIIKGLIETVLQRLTAQGG